MSHSSEHPPMESGDDQDLGAVGDDDEAGSTRPLVSFDTAESTAAPAPPAEQPTRRGGSRLFPQLPDDPRLAEPSAPPEPADEPADEPAYEPLFEPGPTEQDQRTARADADPEVSGREGEAAPTDPTDAFDANATGVMEVLDETGSADDAADAGTPADAGSASSTAASEPSPPPNSAAGVPSGGGKDAAEADRFAQWARLDASASHWREGSQDYEERGVVSDEARTVLHDGASGMGRGGRNLPAAIAVGVVLAALFFGALRLGDTAIVSLIVIVLVLAAAEFYRSARPLGYRPATLAGLVGVGGLSVAVHLRGLAAYPIVLAIATVTFFCWFLVGVEREHPTANLAITVLGLFWVGGLGSFAALMLREPNGDAMLIGAVVGTIAYDIGGYVVGRTTGQSRLSPRISPNKTHEGLIGGIVLSVIITTLVLNKFPGVYPWTESAVDALWLSLAVALVAPIGDLAQSLVKRDVSVKDMGNLLPGHGGVFDRFDALLFALPAAYFVGTYVVG